MGIYDELHRVNYNDLNYLVAAMKGDGVIEGMAMTLSSPTALTVEVADGIYRVGTRLYDYTAAAVTIPTPDTLLPKRDVIVATATGLIVRAGNAATALPSDQIGVKVAYPRPPVVTDAGAVIGEVWVPNGVSAIDKNDWLIDRRIFVGGLVMADKDYDGDHDPLTAAGWEDSTKSGAADINWNSVFGVPTAAKAVAVEARGQDATAGASFLLKADTTTTNPSLTLYANNLAGYVSAYGIVPIDDGGASFYTFSEAWDSFWLRVVGYYM